MGISSISELPLIEEDEAVGSVAQIYAEIKREMQIPIVPNSNKALAISPAALAIDWEFTRSFYKHTTFPESLISMMLYTISERGNCQYCSAGNEFLCRMIGIDEKTLHNLVNDIGSVTPQRVREIIEFSVKAAHDPQGLEAGDYDRLRDQGITDAEIVEIIMIASIAKYSNTLSDALKIPVEDMVIEALGR